jgi:hypothetical protein
MPRLPLTPDERKRLANLQAHAALSGFEVYAAVDVETGKVTYLCKRWALLRELDTLDEIEAWLRRAGVKVAA